MANQLKVGAEAVMISKHVIEGQIRNHRLVIDKPKAAGGTDTGPAPMEYFCFSIAGCIISTAQLVAFQKKLEIKAMRVSASGEIDMNGVLYLNPDIPPGFGSIDIKVALDCDLSAEEKRAFIEEVDRRCPISDTIRARTTIELSV